MRYGVGKILVGRILQIVGKCPLHYGHVHIFCKRNSAKTNFGHFKNVQNQKIPRIFFQKLYTFFSENLEFIFSYGKFVIHYTCREKYVEKKMQFTYTICIFLHFLHFQKMQFSGKPVVKELLIYINKVIKK